MDPGEAGHDPPLTSLSRSVATRRQRWHRVLTVPSGWLLLLCVFLPAWRPCASSEGLPLAIVPFAWPPFIAALLIALVAAAPDVESMQSRGRYLLAFVRTTAIGFAVFSFVAIIDGGASVSAAVAMKIGIVLALVVPWQGTERAVSATAAVTAAIGVVLAVLVATARHSAWGAHVCVVAAATQFVGACWWCVEARLRE